MHAFPKRGSSLREPSSIHQYSGTLWLVSNIQGWTNKRKDLVRANHQKPLAKTDDHMPPVLKSTTTFISNAISIFARLLSSRRPKSFHDLPDDVLIEVFTCLDFPSIISLRRVCIVHRSASVFVENSSMTDLLFLSDVSALLPGIQDGGCLDGRLPMDHRWR